MPGTVFRRESLEIFFLRESLEIFEDSPKKSKRFGIWDSAGTKENLFWWRNLKKDSPGFPRIFFVQKREIFAQRFWPRKIFGHLGKIFGYREIFENPPFYRKKNRTKSRANWWLSTHLWYHHLYFC